MSVAPAPLYPFFPEIDINIDFFNQGRPPLLPPLIPPPPPLPIKQHKKRKVIKEEKKTPKKQKSKSTHHHIKSKSKVSKPRHKKRSTPVLIPLVIEDQKKPKESFIWVIFYDFLWLLLLLILIALIGFIVWYLMFRKTIIPGTNHLTHPVIHHTNPHTNTHTRPYTNILHPITAGPAPPPVIVGPGPSGGSVPTLSWSPLEIGLLIAGIVAFILFFILVPFIIYRRRKNRIFPEFPEFPTGYDEDEEQMHLDEFVNDSEQRFRELAGPASSDADGLEPISGDYNFDLEDSLWDIEVPHGPLLATSPLEKIEKTITEYGQAFVDRGEAKWEHPTGNKMRFNRTTSGRKEYIKPAKVFMKPVREREPMPRAMPLGPLVL